MATKAATMLTRDGILIVQDIKIEEVSVPEWGGKVYVKGMTGAERDSFEATIVGILSKKSDFHNVRAHLASLTICDVAGVRLFTNADVHALGEKSAGALQRIFEVAQRLSGLSSAAAEELTKELEDPLPDSASA